MLSFITHNLLWTEGIFIVGVLFVVGALAYRFYKPLLYVVAFSAVFSIFFFRNPERLCAQAVQDTSVLVCPADGKVVAVVPSEVEGYAQRVAIFLSPLDVHVNWTPIAGIVENITYYPGKFVPAFLPKSSTLNEHNEITVKHGNGQAVLVRQISGTIARRIVCWATEGQDLEVNQKIGMIKFGSRVEVLLPANVEVAVKTGQRVYGGQTMLGRWK